MKKLLTIAMAVLMTLALLTSCGKNNSEPSASSNPTGDDTPAVKVACLLNGNLGDKSFFDSANAGMELIKSELNAETKVIEMGFDNTKWEPTLLDISEQDYDIIIVGTYQMEEILEKVAPQYPNKKYIIFDSSVDYTKDDYKNVYAVTFKQNEASYLAGALASMIAMDDSLPLSNGEGIIGAVAAMDIPVLNDFMIGYIEGAKAVNPDVKVVLSYIGDFNDTAKAKELASAQFKLGACISMNVAAQAGLGLIDAAKAEQRYAIGVDADQAMSLLETNPEAANVIVTSVMKNIDKVIERSVKLHLEGKLPYGTTESLGMAEEAVGIANNEIYQNIATEDMRNQITEMAAKIQNGEIKVSSAFDMTTEQINEVKDSVKP